MTFDYAASAATAVSLLQRFGAAATLKRTTTGAYNPATGTASETVTEHETTAAVVAYPVGYIDGTLIRQGDRKALMAATVEPKAGDALAWQGVDLTIVAVRPVDPAGVAVLYEAQVRG